MEPQKQQQCRDRRREALGDLGVLPDELLCAVLGLLGPTDLACLACVSSVMYILCNEEPLWMNLCLGDGGLLEYKGSWKKTTLVRKNLQPEIQEYSRKGLQFNGFNSSFLYRRWYRCYTTLDTFSLDNGDVERKKDLTSEKFILKYDGQRPVLLTDLSKSWPAKSKWTIDQLLRNYGEVAFRISQRSSKKILMKFKDYVSYIQLQHDEDPLYIFDDKFGEAAPGLLEDYSVPHLFQEDFFDVLDHDQRPPFRWLIIGPERSGASWHVDPALTSAWNTLLSGRKRWALYPPGRVPVGVTVHVNEEDGDVNIESPSSLEWWLDIYPFLAEEDKPLECTQQPGETIFVPSGWWHCVLNLETTIAVTQNFVNKTNFEFVCLDMAPGHRHKGLCRAGLLAIRDEGSYDCKKNASSGVNQLNYPDMTRTEKRLRFNDIREKCVDSSNLNEVRRRSESSKNLHNEEFSYCINFLTMFLEEDRDHYNSIWSPSNCIGQREMRGWLHKLWVTKPELRQLIWKGACIALNAEKWLACITEICVRYNLPSPSDDEKLPVGTGSNPVFLISDYVIKIYVEEGLESSIHGLGTELEFYSLLHKVDSSLINHVPRVLSSGIIANENGAYKIFPWDGKGVPDIIYSNGFSTRATTDDGFSFGVWSKTQFKLNNLGLNYHTHIWPYLITERCKGDIFAHIRDLLSMDDVLHLASFLGEQLRTLHLLPVPHLLECVHLETDKMSLTERVDNCLIKDSDEAAANAYVETDNEGFKILPEWKLIVSVLDSRKKDLANRLVQWGDPIPKFLIEKVEEYIPQDLSLLFDIYKSWDGSYKAGRSPAWIHSDIMDDNIYMQPCTTYSLSDESAPEETSTISGTQHSCNGKVSARKWQPTHILDFSDVCIGDPLYDLIPIYLDVFRGDTSLLKQLLKSYRLSLAGLTAHSNALSCGTLDDLKFRRISYRAMCFCILHEENILGAIFSLWKELRTAQSWQEVEEVVWGELNHYLPSD